MSRQFEISLELERDKLKKELEEEYPKQLIEITYINNNKLKIIIFDIDESKRIKSQIKLKERFDKQYDTRTIFK